jgi:hypothetical protein
MQDSRTQTVPSEAAVDDALVELRGPLTMVLRQLPPLLHKPTPNSKHGSSVTALEELLLSPTATENVVVRDSAPLPVELLDNSMS